MTVPSAVFRFLATDSHTRLLAKPQLRGAEGEELTLEIGEEVPIPRTTFGGVAAGGINTVPIQSFDYRPIGIIVKESKESHQLIEEFMLLANRYVAQHVGKLELRVGQPGLRLHSGIHGQCLLKVRFGLLPLAQRGGKLPEEPRRRPKACPFAGDDGVSGVRR